MTQKIISSLYENYKNSPKKLKIVCDWDEVIQSHEPYSYYLAIKEKIKQELKGEEVIFPNFSEIFEDFWNGKAEKCEIEYFPYGSRMKYKYWTRGDADKDGELTMWNYADDVSVSYSNIKNSPNFYQEAPFLTIAEDLLKLIKEDKVEKLIFLSAYDKRNTPIISGKKCNSCLVQTSGPIKQSSWIPCENCPKIKGETGDKRKYDIFKETFAKLARNWRVLKDDKVWGGELNRENGYLDRIDFQLLGFDSETQGASKADWIKENASDFDIVIDDNPNICRSLVGWKEEGKADWDRHADECMGCSDCHIGSEINITVLAPYYPATENQHHKEVLLVKNEVSDLKREDFTKK